MGRIHKHLKVKLPDPRLAVIDERLKRVKRVIVVASGKGGVGKSLVATTLSLILAKNGRKVGLMDLDFHGPSGHIVLGAKKVVPKEERGIVPPNVHGIKFMSPVYYIGEQPLPLRGTEVSDTFVELLAITKWGRLDYLVIDVPPGIAEEVLDIVRLIKRGEFLIVATPSELAVRTVAKLIKLLLELEVTILGVVENMSLEYAKRVEEQAKELGIDYLGPLPFDREVERSLSRPKKLLVTKFARAFRKVVESKFS